jgi:hypothetical protein
MFLGLFPHLLHHIDSLLFAPRDLTLQLLYAFLLIRRLPTHLLLLLVLLLSQSLLIFQVFELLLIELLKLSTLLGVTGTAKLICSFLLQSKHFLLDS